MSDAPSEDRFTQPPGWRWGEFERGDLKIRFGSVAPPNPEATVILLPGRAEYIEKYFETARDLLAQNFAVYVIDWPGQGKSTRGPELGFGEYVETLHELIEKQVEMKTPLAMLAHSMGGNIGLRYLAKYPETFACAAFSAPMVGIKAISFLPASIAAPVLSAFDRVAGDRLAHGQEPWSDGERPLSSDPARVLVHNRWMREIPALQLGGATWSWLYQAAQSCAILQDPKTASSIRTPCLIALAGKETLVDNKAMRAFAARLKNGTLKEFPDAHHEILMERDESRGEFLSNFYTLIQENII